MKSIPAGVYQHYKGNQYLVLGVAKHSETEEDLVVYVSLYENKAANLWVRPLKMFQEQVVVDGVSTPRFKLMSQ